jgi:hypothetical protein
VIGALTALAERSGVKLDLLQEAQTASPRDLEIKKLYDEACGLFRADIPSWKRAIISVLLVAFLAYLMADFTAYLIMRSMQDVVVNVPPWTSVEPWNSTRASSPRAAAKAASSRSAKLAPFASSTTASFVEQSPSTEIRSASRCCSADPESPSCRTRFPGPGRS